MTVCSTRPLLERLERTLPPAVDEGNAHTLREGAEEHALAVAALAGGGAERVRLAACVYLGDVAALAALADQLPPGTFAATTHAAAEIAGCSPDALMIDVYRAAIQAVGDLAQPPLLSVEAGLRILRAFPAVEEASLWTAEPGEAPRCLASVGVRAPTRRVRAAAREILADGGDRSRERGFVHGVGVARFGHTYGALVIRARPADREAALGFAREARGLLSLALERSFLLERSASRERSLVGASERRLARLGFDIHDGPIQDVAALAADLRFFRTQLGRSLEANLAKELLVARVDDFEARLVALDRELRELAHSLERTSAGERPFAEALRTQIAAFTTRTDIAVKLDLRGDPGKLTTSQRLALLAIIREALVNIRDHSGAREAAITVTVSRSHTHASVVDHGRGFDVERTLVQAARRGRLGLVGMSERIRMLGGRLHLESAPGGPTRVAVTVPRWELSPAETASASHAA